MRMRRGDEVIFDNVGFHYAGRRDHGLQGVCGFIHGWRWSDYTFSQYDI